jgi:hypothetical protein
MNVLGIKCNINSYLSHKVGKIEFEARFTTRNAVFYDEGLIFHFSQNTAISFSMTY